MDVSIIIPTLNNENTIGRAIMSLINQKTNLSFEIVIIVNYKGEKTLEICKQYEREYDSIKVLVTKEFTAKARQEAVDFSHGDYLMFLDGDDYYHENMIEHMYHLIRDNDADIAQCAYYYVRDKGTKPTKLAKNKVLNQAEAIKSLMKDIYVHGFMWNKIYKASLMRNANITYPNELMVREDVLLNFKLFLKINKFVMSKEPLYYYDKTGGGITSSINKRRIEWFLIIMALERHFIEESKKEDLLKAFRQVKLYRKFLILGDELINKKGYTKEEYKALKKVDRKLLKIINSKDPLPLENMPWSNYLKL